MIMKQHISIFFPSCPPDEGHVHCQSDLPTGPIAYNLYERIIYHSLVHFRMAQFHKKRTYFATYKQFSALVLEVPENACEGLSV
jgi:hypothetical protein